MKKGLLIIWLFFIFGCHKVKPVMPVINQEPIDKVLSENEIEFDVFLARKEINDDYLGEIQVGNIIDEFIFQCDDNEFYLSHDFNKENYSSVSIFLDFRNEINDQNLIFYGHYVYNNEELMFSPLHELKDKNIYEENKIVTIELENEIKNYIITDIYYFNLNQPDLIYYFTNYDKTGFENYYKKVKEIGLIDSGINIKYGEKFITLQTCVRNRNDLRLIVLAKEMEQ